MNRRSILVKILGEMKFCFRLDCFFFYLFPVLPFLGELFVSDVNDSAGQPMKVVRHSLPKFVPDFKQIETK